MKHLQTFEKYYVEGDILYHYTSLSNAIEIIRSNILKTRRRTGYHKYTNNPNIYNNYGFVSFTENEEYHDLSETSIPCECRFVFNISDLEKDYELTEYDANKVELDTYLYDNNIEEEDMDDLERQELEYFGEEMEIRIYSSDIPLKKYLVRLEIFDFMKPHSPTKFKNLIEECELFGIEYTKIKY